jgi:glycosyltransferase involved in cell wall biosynthesis
MLGNAVWEPMNSPLVSIIVNVHNGERYVGECIDSILALKSDAPLEVIITDDASTDGTSTVLQRYTDSRFKLVRFERNVGAAAAINCAFSLVRGEFVARIDYDDRYHPDFLTASLSMLRAHPEAAFVCASVRMIDSDGVPSERTGPELYGEQAGVADRFASLLARHFVTAPTILGRTECWRRAIPIPAGMDFCDWYMNLTMAETAPVAVLDAITADYRIHPQNMHTTKVRSGMGERVTFNVLDRFLEASPRKAELAPQAKRIRAWHFADWGDKYFAAEMDVDCLRCYRAAVSLDPTLLFKASLVRRAAGIFMGRTRYERIKSLVRSCTG